MIIPTFNRRDLCIRAVRSVLAQTHPPLEILVCDNDSSDDTRGAIEQVAREDDRVRYLRLPSHAETPAAPRNLGLRTARGDFVAFLDDDDVWLPEKLSLQSSLLSQHSIVCANAERSDGRSYFSEVGAQVIFRRRDLLVENPVITSTAVVDRRRLLDAGGFPEGPRFYAIEDYGAWLAVSDTGGTVVRLPTVVARYETGGETHLSTRASTTQRRMARLAFRRWKQRPSDLRLATAVARHWARTAKLLARSLLSRAS